MSFRFLNAKVNDNYYAIELAWNGTRFDLLDYWSLTRQEESRLNCDATQNSTTAVAFTSDVSPAGCCARGGFSSKLGNFILSIPFVRVG